MTTLNAFAPYSLPFVTFAITTKSYYLDVIQLTTHLEQTHVQ